MEVARVSTLITQLELNNVSLIKMDIEGSEYDVIEDLISSDILPNQLLIEFHHRVPPYTIGDTDTAIAKLKDVGYKIFAVSASGQEFSFIR